ncbi:hypothetical protein SSABA_v1c06710 [Spiroplasma sabaudiense Ar-1343]|uniref:Transmembrane protein n=1 Tax=Spiroplasma sabaudiense Ar-1343 TaxID=1276257 RepID=W6AA55_9MOLU|nr:hypothetical protein [Spiroplasma sabaudiense]AHI54073.1 hypothetical protein SSABA_v1c06710 [Spiroplasma sabaudiense Ar-1343]
MFENERYEWMSDLNVGVTFVTWFFCFFIVGLYLIGGSITWIVTWKTKSELVYKDLFKELNEDNGFNDIKIVSAKKGLRMPFFNYNPLTKEFQVKPWELERQNLASILNLFFSYVLIIETRVQNTHYRRSLLWMTSLNILALFLGLISFLIVLITPYGLSDATLQWFDFSLQIINYFAMGLIFISWISLAFIYESLGKLMNEMAVHYLSPEKFKRFRAVVGVYAFIPLIKNPFLITKL